MSAIRRRRSRRRTLRLLTILIALAAVFIGIQRCASVPPPPTTEFRGVWVATVNNLDWPSKPGLTTEQQQREMTDMFDKMASLHLNAIVFQVRPSSDAFYPSQYEPWSPFLTGEMGKAPEPFYDPLQFAVTEAHKRGMELHAWINPYRVRHERDKMPPSANHISQTHPELVRQYGKYLWLDPGEPAVREHVMNVLTDIVRRYDIDALHIDDYFYPYPEKDAQKQNIPFPDDQSYERYRAAGGTLERDDWRRKNVDDLVEQVSLMMRREKPAMRFGISPFGFWRPGYPPGVVGFDAYAGIYADSKKWMQNGWVDYIAPQLYWRPNAPGQKFSDLLRWWRTENTRGIGMWPGLPGHRVANGQPNGMPVDEVVWQINQIRRGPKPGWIIFRAGNLMQNRGGLADRLRKLNGGPAKVPVITR